MISKFIRHIPDHSCEYIIFDLGTRDCLQSIEFYRAFPKARIFAFEANPTQFEICRKNIERYSDRITLVEGAVCNYDGEITFYPIDQEKTKFTWCKDGNPGASSLFKANEKFMPGYIQYEIKTKCFRLDTFMKEYNIPKVDIMWLDLQGAELMALQGLGEYINDVKYVQSEVEYVKLYKDQPLVDDVTSFMISKGFELREKLASDRLYGDYIYVRH